MARKVLVLVAWTSAGLLLAGPVDVAAADCPVAPDSLNELAKIVASDAAANDNFGISICVEGDVAVIGATQFFGGGNGAAYVYRFDGFTWIEEAKLTADDGVAGDNFADSVAVSGDVAVITAPGNTDGGVQSGTAYVFERNQGGPDNWGQVARLIPSDIGDWIRYGRSAAVSGDVALIGAQNPPPAFGERGGVYVWRFDGSTWVEETMLTASDAQGMAEFGNCISISADGNAALIGAPFDRDANPSDPYCRSGSAYVFRFDGTNWGQEAKLLASDMTCDDQFGTSVSLSADGEVALIGAHLDDDGGNSAGSAYVFEMPPGGWENMTETAKLTASEGDADDQFGWSVSMSGDVAVIGAKEDDPYYAGSAYVFQKPAAGWANMTESLKLTGSALDSRDRFGWSVSISGHTALIGAKEDDDGGSNAGAAYAFAGLSDCNDNGVLDICDIADGTSPDANGNGIPDECEGCAGDVDGDGDTDLSDLAALLTAYGSFVGQPSYNANADFDDDEDVDLSDLAFLLADYGCGP